MPRCIQESSSCCSDLGSADLAYTETLRILFHARERKSDWNVSVSLYHTLYWYTYLTVSTECITLSPHPLTRLMAVKTLGFCSLECRHWLHSLQWCLCFHKCTISWNFGWEGSWKLAEGEHMSRLYHLEANQQNGGRRMVSMNHPVHSIRSILTLPCSWRMGRSSLWESNKKQQKAGILHEIGNTNNSDLCSQSGLASIRLHSLPGFICVGSHPITHHGKATTYIDVCSKEDDASSNWIMGHRTIIWV